MTEDDKLAQFEEQREAVKRQLEAVNSELKDLRKRQRDLMKEIAAWELLIATEKRRLQPPD